MISRYFILGVILQPQLSNFQFRLENIFINIKFLISNRISISIICNTLHLTLKSRVLIPLLTKYRAFMQFIHVNLDLSVCSYYLSVRDIFNNLLFRKVSYYLNCLFKTLAHCFLYLLSYIILTKQCMELT